MEKVSTRVVVANDHAGLPLVETVMNALAARGVAAEHLGVREAKSVDYPDFAHEVARKVIADGVLGILICGSGIGMSIAANRHAGVRAVVCSEAYSAAMARRHNNANVLCFGARVVGPGVAEELVAAFVSASFEDGRHAARVQKIENVDS